MEVLFSVIIPVYNSSHYIEQCIDSILQQSFTDFELIIVDDGSTDNSFELCERYRTENSKIKLFTQQNQGVSAARNKGITVSKGRYIVFVDSDDYLDKDFLLHISLRSEDYVLIGYQDVFQNKLIEHKPKLRVFSQLSEDDKASLLNEIGSIFVWAKRYSREIINTYNLRFNDRLRFSEDMLFNLQYLKFINSYCSINKCGYYYRHYDEISLSKAAQAYDFIAKNKFREIAFETLVDAPVLRQAMVDQSMYYSELEIERLSTSIVPNPEKRRKINEIIKQKTFQYGLKSPKHYFPLWLKTAYKVRYLTFIIWRYNQSKKSKSE